ncbi:MAG: glycosyltransferase [Vicinamibacterales bacterium]
MAHTVLHVIPAVAPRYGGPSVATFGMCRALAGYDVDCVVATTDADGPERLPVETGSIVRYGDVPVIFFPRTFSESLKWSGPLASWVHSHVSGFDLVHIHAVFSHASITAGRACRRAGVPYLVRPLGNLDPWSLARHGWRKQVLLRLGARELLRRADAIHYTSDAERALAERALPGLPRGVVVPLGVEDDLFAGTSPVPPNEPPYLLALCRLDVKKGIDLLIEAFHALHAGGSAADWSLTIAGDGDPAYVARLHRLADTGAARDRITFRGWVTGPERHALIAGAGAFALPSHQENFGLSVVEAMACAVPVIITPGVNVSSEVAQHHAGWVVPRERGAWAQALARVLADRTELARRGRLARGLAEQFRWPSVGRQLVDAYGALLRPRAADASPARQASPRPRFAPPAGARMDH